MFPIPVANRKYRFQTGNRSKNDVSVSKTPKSVYFSILNLFPIFSYTFANWKYLVQTGRMILSRKFQIGVILNFQSICGVSKTKLNLRFRRILFFSGVSRNYVLFCQHFLMDLIEKWFPKSPEVTRQKTSPKLHRTMREA